MQINRETGTIEFSLAGIVSADDILKGIELFKASSLDFDLRGFVWDMRDADLSDYDYEGMRLVFGANPLDRQLGKLRIATVTSKFVDKRLLGLWEVVASQYDDNERQVFLSIKEARIWVSENPAKGHGRSHLA